MNLKGFSSIGRALALQLQQAIASIRVQIPLWALDLKLHSLSGPAVDRSTEAFIWSTVVECGWRVSWLERTKNKVKN